MPFLLSGVARFALIRFVDGQPISVSRDASGATGPDVLDAIGDSDKIRARDWSDGRNHDVISDPSLEGIENE